MAGSGVRALEVRAFFRPLTVVFRAGVAAVVVAPDPELRSASGAARDRDTGHRFPGGPPLLSSASGASLPVACCGAWAPSLKRPALAFPKATSPAAGKLLSKILVPGGGGVAVGGMVVPRVVVRAVAAIRPSGRGLPRHLVVVCVPAFSATAGWHGHRRSRACRWRVSNCSGKSSFISPIRCFS